MQYRRQRRRRRQILFVCVDIIIKILLSKLSAFVAALSLSSQSSPPLSLSTPTQQWQLPKKIYNAKNNNDKLGLSLSLCVLLCLRVRVFVCVLVRDSSCSNAGSHTLARKLAHIHTRTLAHAMLSFFSVVAAAAISAVNVSVAVAGTATVLSQSTLAALRCQRFVLGKF